MGPFDANERNSFCVRVSFVTTNVENFTANSREEEEVVERDYEKEG